MNVEYIIGAWVIIFIFVALFVHGCRQHKKGAASGQLAVYYMGILIYVLVLAGLFSAAVARETFYLVLHRRIQRFSYGFFL